MLEKKNSDDDRKLHIFKLWVYYKFNNTKCQHLISTHFSLLQKQSNQWYMFALSNNSGEFPENDLSAKR